MARKGKRVDVSLGRQFMELTNDAEVVAQLAEPSPSPSPEGCVHYLIPARVSPQTPAVNGEVHNHVNKEYGGGGGI